MPSFSPVGPITAPQRFFQPGALNPPGPTQVPPPITADFEGASSVTANLTATGTLASAISGTSSVAGTLGAIGVLACTIAGSGSVVADVHQSPAIAANIEGRGSVVGFLTLPPLSGRKVPYILRDFGVSTKAPAYLSTSGTGLTLFHQPSFLPGVSAGTVTPPAWSTIGMPDGVNYQGRVQAPGELLVGPENGGLSGKIYTVVAQGMIFVPSSAINPSFNLIINQNYFTFNAAQITDSLFSVNPYISLTPGTMVGFSLTATLAGNGLRSGVLSCAGALTVNGVSYYGNGFSNRLVGREPLVQLSLGLQFNESLSGGDTYQAFLSKFELYNRGF